MYNKLFRFIVIERQMRVKVLVLFSFILLMGLQISALKAQDVYIAQVKSDMDLIGRIPQMEAALEMKKRVVRPEFTNENDIPVQLTAIQGLMVSEGVPYVMINSDIYKEGDRYGDYTVMEITNDSTKLFNHSTKEMKRLYFPN